MNIDDWQAATRLTQAAIAASSSQQQSALRRRLKNPNYTSAIVDGLTFFWTLAGEGKATRSDITSAYSLLREKPRDARNAALMAFCIGVES